MRRIAGFLLFLLSTTLYASEGLTNWLATEVTPIKEKDLLSVKTRWPKQVVAYDSVRASVATAASYAESDGSINSKITVSYLTGLTDTTVEDGLRYVLYYIRGVEGDRDDAVWLFVYDSQDEILSHSCIGQLQTTCAQTYLRGCVLQEDGSLQVLQLKHEFNCETDEFVQTETLDSYVLRISDAGTIGTFEK